ncbi:transglutaminase family protein [Desulfosarcina ovata]|uniref:Transglutaminase n=1 Tax=Desulfosarcina ovata subsp. ovata TaxID=2752305 RepID=A0A5K8AFL9_9BACT|nr:transglutaminase family protein [Desulfosarcina ovata]BBO91493.1 transglutaminase [Desulfosarcina ovata subsp. ovata]
MRYRITHKTAYRYSEPASLSQNELILKPRMTATQTVGPCRLEIVPQPQYLSERIDFFGNTVQGFMVQHPHSELAMTAFSEMEILPQGSPPPESTPPWEQVAQQLTAHTGSNELDAYQFVFASPLVAVGAAVREYARVSFPPHRPVLAGAMDLMGRIFTGFTYDKTATTVDTGVDQVLADRKGVCQDFAHLAISGLRSLGLAARYVSGYLETLPPPGKPKLVGADASHAWLSLFVPGFGWVDLDPTNNLIPGERHITLAWGRDYGDVTPVKGVVMGGGVHALSVMVDVAAQS